MGEFLQNMYVWLWAALAILMIIVGIKYRHEHQGLLAVLMAVFFIFMTVWYGLRTFAGYPMFEGTLNIIFRCILGGFLVALGLMYKKQIGQQILFLLSIIFIFIFFRSCR